LPIIIASFCVLPNGGTENPIYDFSTPQMMAFTVKRELYGFLLTGT
jgi:hypothetical protein